MRTVLHVALNAPGGYTNKPFIQAFIDNGFHSYWSFDLQLEMFTYGKEEMRKRLLAEAEKLKPDLVFMQVQNSEMLDLDTVKKLGSISFVVNYTFDMRSKEQTEWLYAWAPFVGLICVSNLWDIDEFRNRGFENAMCLQSSCDMEMYAPALSAPEKKGIAFIGGNYEHSNYEFPMAKERKEMVELLKDRYKEQFSVYGMGWPGSNPTFLPNVETDAQIYRRSLIAISHNHFLASLYTSDRIWRIMASGCFCLTKYFQRAETMFTCKEHIDWWTTFDELTDKIDHYLQAPFHALQIGERGMNHVRKNHTWSNRIEEMLAFIKKIRKKQPMTDACLKAGAHVIDGIIPDINGGEQFDGRVCDCGKLKWKWEECGCATKQYQLRAYENII